MILNVVAGQSTLTLSALHAPLAQQYDTPRQPVSRSGGGAAHCLLTMPPPSQGHADRDPVA
ncbi:protein of unknown function [Methylorubrum extorquens]|uniref:Uncharacterized protein n=1 Tax=Methylorubrum extorquens TaxID=408 RepID=A0A2N9AYP1_METEX|nr:protein of unknown function [Methylorubrum extorquens]